jgi:phenylacetate-CoA ligase
MTAAPAADPFWVDYAQARRAWFDGTMTASGLRDWQARRLAVVLDHVTSRSAFYRDRLAGLDLTEVTPGSLSLLPFTTKADLRASQHAVLSGGPADALVYYETTGTTGPPTPCPRSAKDVMASNAAVEESWERVLRHYFGERLPVIGLMGPSELYAFGDTFGEVAQRIGACHVKIWPESPRVGFRKALRLMSELGVEVIVCAPALCLSLAKAAMHYGYDLRRDFSVKLFLVLGEISTPEFADNVASVWGAAMHPTLYGSQEALAIATGCARGRLHIAQLNYLVEVLDQVSGAPLGQTGDGELCLTMLVDGIKPLLRYRTGDLVTVRRGDCGCGLPGDMVAVRGRAADGLWLGERMLHPADLEAAILRDIRGCLGYQVVVDRDTAGQDRLTVLLDLAAAGARPAGTGVADRLGRLTGVPVQVEVTDALDPVTATGSFVSWKAARIQDDRAERDLETQTARGVASRYVVTT